MSLASPAADPVAAPPADAVASDGARLETRRIVYNDWIARWFVGAAVVWGLVGMLVGVLAALQLAYWQANLPPYLSFGRIRPLHTNAVIFAFVGNMMFAGVYYSTQRLVKAMVAGKPSPYSDDELAAIWNGTDTGSDFDQIVRILLLTGCRRTHPKASAAFSGAF